VSAFSVSSFLAIPPEFRCARSTGKLVIRAASGSLFAPHKGEPGIDIPNLRKAFPSKDLLITTWPEHVYGMRSLLGVRNLSCSWGIRSNAGKPTCFRSLVFRVLYISTGS
jgi:hypothetical protein